MMDLMSLKTALQASGFPVAYSHFLESENDPLPEPPFVVYFASGDENFKADNRTFKKIPVVQIELYTKNKDLQAEEKLEEILNNINLPYNSSEVYIETEKLFQKLFEVRLI